MRRNMLVLNKANFLRVIFKSDSLGLSPWILQFVAIAMQSPLDYEVQPFGSEEKDGLIAVQGFLIR